MPDVFISYKREERNVAQKLAEALIEKGYSVWWDVNLLPGNRFAQEIEAVIQHAKVAIVIWSHQSVNSDWVIEEATEAKRRDILIPVRIDTAEPPFGFRRLQTLDLSRWDRESYNDDFTSLIELISHQVANSPKINEPKLEKISLDNFRLEAEFWRSISSATNQSSKEYHSYIERFGENAQFSDLAKGRILALKEGKPSKLFDNWLARIGAIVAVLSSLVALTLTFTKDDEKESSIPDQPDISIEKPAEPEPLIVTADQEYEVVSATLSFSGDSNDYITEGKSYKFTHGKNAFFSVTELNSNQIGFDLETPDSWSFSLSFPLNDGFRLGTFYTASREAFSGDHFAGLDLTGDGRGCNELTASFNIESLRLVQGIPVEARISFSQFCDSETEKAQGNIEYKVAPK